MNSESAYKPKLIDLSDRNKKSGPRLYMPVSERMAWFRAEHPSGRITATIEAIGDMAYVRAQVFLSADSPLPEATGMATLRSGEKQVWAGRELEKAETAAMGRALAFAGYGTTQAGDDLEEGDFLADSPVEQQTSPLTKPRREPYELSELYDVTAFLFPETPEGAHTQREFIQELIESDRIESYYSLDAAASIVLLEWSKAQLGFDSPKIVELLGEAVGKPVDSYGTWLRQGGKPQEAWEIIKAGSKPTKSKNPFLNKEKAAMA